MISYDISGFCLGLESLQICIAYDGLEKVKGFGSLDLLVFNLGWKSLQLRTVYNGS